MWTRGRYVIWNQELPYCFNVKEVSKAIEYLAEFKNVKEINRGGPKFINDNFNNKEWTGRLIKVYEEVGGCP